MEKKKLGFTIAIISAVIYGLMPLQTKAIYGSGSNSYTVAFLRFVIGAAAFYAAFKASAGGSVGISRKECGKLLICGISFGFVPVLLYTSYNYLATGLATTLHFVYPVFVVLGSVLFKIEKLTKKKVICCLLCMAGIVAFYTPGGEISLLGAAIALLSGVLYAFYTVYLTASGILTMDPLKLSFWKSVFASAGIGIFSLIFGKFSFCTGVAGWSFMALLGLTTACASLLYQQATKYAGGQNTAMLSTFEPLTSVIVGYFVFQEELTGRSLLGIACILLSVILLSIGSEKAD